MLNLDLNTKNSGEKTPMAPTITNINDGSHAPKIFRKPKTFSGLTIPEIVKPNPKIIPEIKEIIFVNLNPEKKDSYYTCQNK